MIKELLVCAFLFGSGLSQDVSHRVSRIPSPTLVTSDDQSSHFDNALISSDTTGLSDGFSSRFRPDELDALSNRISNENLLSQDDIFSNRNFLSTSEFVDGNLFSSNLLPQPNQFVDGNLFSSNLFPQTNQFLDRNLNNLNLGLRNQFLDGNLALSNQFLDGNNQFLDGNNQFLDGNLFSSNLLPQTNQFLDGNLNNLNLGLSNQFLDGNLALSNQFLDGNNQVLDGNLIRENLALRNQFPNGNLFNQNSQFLNSNLFPQTNQFSSGNLFPETTQIFDRNFLSSGFGNRFPPGSNLNGQFESYSGLSGSSNFSPNVDILRDERRQFPDGSYSFGFHTEDGTTRQETGTLNPFGNIVQQGSYSFTYPDGTPAFFRYIADENGFRVVSNTLPPTPPHAQAQIERAPLIGGGNYPHSYLQPPQQRVKGYF